MLNAANADSVPSGHIFAIIEIECAYWYCYQLRPND